MTGLDTNILVRFIVRDDAAQARAADESLGALSAAGEKAFINTLVMCELAWVLHSVYRYPRELIAETIERILRVSHFEVEHRDLTWGAHSDYVAGRADFADCLIARINQSAGCAETITFDRQAANLPGFRLLG